VFFSYLEIGVASAENVCLFVFGLRTKQVSAPIPAADLRKKIFKILAKIPLKL